MWPEKVIVLFCFLTGLLSRTDLSKKANSCLESTILSNIPGYTFIKSMGESFTDVDMGHGYETILAQIEDAWQIAFLVDSLTY